MKTSVNLQPCQFHSLQHDRKNVIKVSWFTLVWIIVKNKVESVALLRYEWQEHPEIDHYPQLNTLTKLHVNDTQTNR